MITLGQRRRVETSLVALFGTALLVIGVGALVSPQAAATAFGVPEAGAASPAFLWAAGVRDFAVGCFALLLVALRVDGRVLGGFVLVTALIPVGDVAIVYASAGTSTLPALLLHAVSIVFLLVLGASMWRGAGPRETAG